MRTLDELIDRSDPAFPLIQEWAASAVRPVELLPPSPDRAEALRQTQVTTRSTMGAVVYETGGILVDHGWLRFLGSGYPRLTRTLPGWNEGRSEGFYLVADDAAGGFFAVNGGALGPDVKAVHYFAPDSLRWESLRIGYSEFLGWAMSGNLDEFYAGVRWQGWETDAASLHGDRCFFWYPPLWTKEGRGGAGQRTEIPVEEAWGVQRDSRWQLTAIDYKGVMQMNEDKEAVSLLDQIQRELPEMPLIILSRLLAPQSTRLDIQDYIVNGERIIPLFRSGESSRASTGGVDLGRPMIQISRTLLAQVSGTADVFVLDPQLPNELRFTGEELKRALLPLDKTPT